MRLPLHEITGQSCKMLRRRHAGADQHAEDTAGNQADASQTSRSGLVPETPDHFDQ